jgi:hypothetical protein
MELELVADAPGERASSELQYDGAGVSWPQSLYRRGDDVLRLR